MCFTDTFETGDSHYRYGQVVVDYRSRFGDAFTIRSKKKVGWAFGEFCCRYVIPLIYRLAQGQARQTKSKKENRYVIKVMKVRGEGDAVPWVRENQRMYQLFNWSIII